MMQISDALGRYNSNMQPGTAGQAAGTARTSQTQGAKAQSGPDLSGLQKGNVFEGTIGSMKNGQVQLMLSDGSSISARLGGDVQLTEGQSLFFEVKSNEGGTIEIKPFTTEGGGISNPTILSALDAAGITATPEHVRMVDTLMQEGMSIDKQSLGMMSRLIASHSDIDPTTLIQMNKLGIPITNEMAAQFENYKTDSHQILNKMNEILTSVADTLGGEGTDGAEALALNDKLLQILTGEEAEVMETPQNEVQQGAAEAAGEGAAEAAVLPEEAAVAEEAGKTADPNTAQKATEQANTDPLRQQGQAAPVSDEANAFLKALQDTDSAKQAAQTGNGIRAAEQAPERLLKDGVKPQEPYPQGTLGAILTKEEAADMEKSLRALNKDGSLAKANLSLDMTAEEFAKALNDELKSLDQPDAKALKSLLSGKGYLSVLKELTKEQWSVKPEQLSGDRIKDLYENLDRQMKQTENVLREMGMKDTELAKSVSDLKNNLEFMDQVNQNYTYLQIPIQFQNQTAHSDLYVYTNKKNLQDKDAELTAFLHLDMEHLGSTDVSVRMKNRAVNTKFYMEDDAAFDLIMAHADELAKRLEEKGYHCKVEAVNDAKEVDFVEDFMKQGQNAGGLIHRYSFDIKA